jgi:hypothetical protein
MKKIAWIIDGSGWGYDNFAASIAKAMPQYQHVQCARSKIIIKGVACFCEDANLFVAKLCQMQPDIVVLMNPKNLRRIAGPNVVCKVGLKCDRQGPLEELYGQRVNPRWN